MKTLFLTCLLTGLALMARAEDAVWLTDLDQAKAVATQQHKAVFLDFTGSDWCGWCKKLEAETFTQPDFIQFAKQRLVLVRIDFPRSSPLPAAQQSANQALAQQFGISGFPTLVCLDATGKELWKNPGYLPGGPSAMIAALVKVLPKVKSTPPVASATPAPATKSPSDFPRLTGIVYSSHPVATLDGKVCVVGDTVNGAKILEIRRDSVLIEAQGQRKELSVN